MNTLIIALIVCVVVIVLFVWPLQMAAKMIEAKRSGFGSCMLALIASNVLGAILFAALPQLFVVAVLVDIVITAFVFAGVLGTTFMKAVAITIIYWVFFVGLLFVAFFVAATFGLALTLPFALI